MRLWGKISQEDVSSGASAGVYFRLLVITHTFALTAIIIGGFEPTRWPF